jgi:hypothetical protein
MLETVLFQHLKFSKSRTAVSVSRYTTLELFILQTMMFQLKLLLTLLKSTCSLTTLSIAS